MIRIEANAVSVTGIDATPTTAKIPLNEHLALNILLAPNIIPANKKNCIAPKNKELKNTCTYYDF